MTTPNEVVFLLDVDNTLLDNDRVQADLKRYLEREFGIGSSNRYWAIFDQLPAELGYADYLGALQRYRVGATHDPRLLTVSSFLVDYPFANRLYPGSLDAIEHLRKWGQTVILSDGDVVFQPRKVQRSGLWEAVEGRVLIYIHKEQMLDDVRERHPARHYVMIDDKLHILAAMKSLLGDQLTTVFLRQGHYARSKNNCRQSSGGHCRSTVAMLNKCWRNSLELEWIMPSSLRNCSAKAPKPSIRRGTI